MKVSSLGSSVLLTNWLVLVARMLGSYESLIRNEYAQFVVVCRPGEYYAGLMLHATVATH